MVSKVRSEKKVRKYADDSDGEPSAKFKKTA